MSTRKCRTFSTNTNTPPKSDLLSPRRGKATAQHKTTLPLSSVRFNTVMYILSGLALASIGFNAWRLLQLKTAAGGWRNLASGKRPHDSAAAHRYDAGDGKGADGGRDGIEDRINSLAEALGLPSHELASAIADAVMNYVPPASLSSISAAEAMHSGTAVRVEAQPGTDMEDRLSTFAGFDDPVME